LFWRRSFSFKKSSISQLINYYTKHHCDILFGVVKAPKSLLIQGGVIKTKEGTKNQVALLKEKPSLKELQRDSSYTNYYSIGRFILTPAIFEYLVPSSTGKDGELWLQEANNLLAQSKTGLFLKLKGEFFTTGDPLNFIKASIRYSLDRKTIKKPLKKYLLNFS
jgi:UTP--glucose-1-phosphate uridylyltransferase